MSATQVRTQQVNNNAGVAIIDFGAAGQDIASLAITGQGAILTTSKIFVSVMAVDSADHSADEHLVEQLSVRAGNIIAGTGFTIYGVTTGLALRGKFNVSWMWV